MYYFLFVVVLVLVANGLRVVQQYQKGVVFRFGKIVGIKEPGLNLVIPFIDILRKVDMRTITMRCRRKKLSPKTMFR